MIKAAIFDMDGLLVNTEPLWRKAEIQAFSTVGKHMTNEMCKETMGFRTSEVMDYWFVRAPWEGVSKKELEQHLIELVNQLILEEAKALPGVHAAIETCKKAGLKTAIASSSASKLIDSVVDKLGIRGHFDIIKSAENEIYGKPHPAVFLNTAKLLEVSPQECLVFEDSVFGTIAAKAAFMKCISVPSAEDSGSPKFSIADIQLRSLEEFKLKHIAQLY